MSHELSKAYEPFAIEEKWARIWAEENLFAVSAPENTNGVAKAFVQLLPPPNVTGRLHMGHMLNQTEMDILARWHRMRGETTVWVPGTDHAGIATQMMVERQLASEGGPTRTELGREAFTERVWSWKKQYGGAITEQMRRLGASVDWSREYFTMDDRLSLAVREAFVRLYEQGLIYRGAYIVNWDPVLRTAVSDLEVESEERPGKLYHIRYDLADGSGSITIATTRPETMLGDVAVAVNPNDARYQSFLGKKLVLPLSGVSRENAGAPREIPVLADDWADPDFGTGAVKVTPAHDPNDFAIGQRHGLPNLSIMDETAHIVLPGSPYHGMERFAARERIVQDLEAMGALVSVKDHTHAVPISQRTGVVIEPRLSMQWFLAVNKEPLGPDGQAGGESIAAKAIAAVRDGHIRFTPEMYAKTYFEWMNNIHDWCLSRQLWWGHRIPAWHCGACGKITVTLDAAPVCSGCGMTDIQQETDVLDTWFSSGLLPFTVFGWDGALQGQAALTPDLAAFYPTDLLVTGFDILFFWVARMIMLGCHLTLDVPMPDGSPRSLENAVPFKDVYIHGLIRDANREKMSKTKGNVIDPIEIISRYGTDAVRFTLASQASPGTDIAFNEARTEGYRAFANKIWNAARFLAMQIERGREAGYSIISLSAGETKDGPRPVVPDYCYTSTPCLEAQWIFGRLHTVSATVARALGEYRFDEAASAVYQFFWAEFCDWYLEISKLRLDFSSPNNGITAWTLTDSANAFESALRLLSPFMPFLTEELWHALFAQAGFPIPAKSIALARYPQSGDFRADEPSVSAMTMLQELIVTVRGLRKELGVPEKEATPIQVFGSVARLAKENADMLARLARVSAVEVAREAPTGNNARATASFDVAVLYERQIDVPAERDRLNKELARLNKGMDAAERQLGNEGFVAKAPAHIVEGLKKQAAETRALKEKAEAALAALPPA